MKYNFIKIKIDRQKILSHVKTILGSEYVNDINIHETDAFYHIRIYYNSVIFSSELKKLDSYFKTEWANITYSKNYNNILYMIDKKNISFVEEKL